jgi:hypothetical protein
MATLRVDTLYFHFDSNIEARKYDESRHYLEVVRVRGKRAVDVTAVRPGNNPSHAWLIEAKDYRQLRGLPKDSLPSEIADDVLRKVTETLEGLSDTVVNGEEEGERSHAARVLGAHARHVVFHLEPHVGRSKISPGDPSANVAQKLKQLFRDQHLTPQVLSIRTTAKAGVPWTVS